MARRKGYTQPVKYEVFQRTNGKTRKVNEYRSDKHFRDRMSLYAEAAPDAEVYVLLMRSEWFKVTFNQLRNQDGSLVEFGWEMKPSDGVANV